jgi:hypothetical protein
MATSTRRRAAAAAGVVICAVLATPGTAEARPDPGTTVRAPAAATPTACPLRRVGTRLVVCDNLTGGGVTAARWVPEWRRLSLSTR